MAEKNTSGERFMDDVSALASIPHRGPATPGEAKAADYVAERLRELGMSPSIEPFMLAPHFPITWALHGVFAALLCWLATCSPVWAAILTVPVIISFWGDSSTRFYMLRKLMPKRESRHVIGKVSAPGAKEGADPVKRIIIASHIDAGQMGLTLNPNSVRSSTKLFKAAFGMQPLYLWFWFWSVAAVAPVSLLYGATGGAAAVKWILVFLAIFNLIHSVLFTQLEFAAISPGASDNASAVAVMLDLARRFNDKPLANSEIWYLGDGSEETYMNGMAKFFGRPPADS
ncbi:MAG: M28 family peptidase [Deltaproteobacteria bacterium]|nr:M28 family peptidase [Deltaproteobacteria bacterium]